MHSYIYTKWKFSFYLSNAFKGEDSPDVLACVSNIFDEKGVFLYDHPSDLPWKIGILEFIRMQKHLENITCGRSERDQNA